ncbi:MAG: hypothetical protein K2J70_03900 [Muribaculaceae bacterium]|nr:hypothetical protein [Muribaculaceae bacterium]
MRKAIVSACAAVMLFLSGCGQERLSPLGNLGQPSLSDSLVYYYGLAQGEEYFAEAREDTSMLSRRERERYLKGLKDGLRAVEEVNDTYNKGLEKGIRLALALYEYEARFGETFNRELLYQSIAYALEGDSIPDGMEVTAHLRQVFDKLDFKKREEIVKNMHLSLSAEAVRLKMKKLADDLYVTDANPGSGPLIRRGDYIFATLNYILESGRNLEMPSAQQLMVGGPTMSEVMDRVYTRMRKGGSAQYATTAFALFGDRAYQLQLKPEEVVLMSVEINNVINPDTTGKREVIAM